MAARELKAASRSDREPTVWHVSGGNRMVAIVKTCSAGSVVQSAYAASVVACNVVHAVPERQLLPVVR